jgi:large subunit ribosomal protein L23
MQKLRQDKPNAKRPKPRKWFRPKSIKKMMVELERPFVWPEAPENLEMYVLIFLELGIGLD